MGRFGITGKSQTQPILQLSDGLRSRLVFAWLAYKTPHILALVSALPSFLEGLVKHWILHASDGPCSCLISKHGTLGISCNICL